MEAHAGMHFFSLPFMLFFWIVVVPKILHAIRHGHHGRRGAPEPSADGGAEDRALTTLRERFARGEIDRAEYEERRQAFSGRLPHWP